MKSLFMKERKFESNVIYIGTKTVYFVWCCFFEFESNVIYIGTKTKADYTVLGTSLRVM